MLLYNQFKGTHKGGKTMNEVQLTPYYVGEIIKHPELFKLDALVHYDLGIDYPFVEKVCNEYKRVAEKLNIPFYIIKPTTTWEEMYGKYNFPTRRVRWCNKLKMDCAKQLEKWQAGLGRKVIHYIGFCADETKRFKDNDDIYPLVILGINENEILEEAKKIKLFDDYYKVCNRQGCMFCPMLSRRELAYIYLKYPDKYLQFLRFVKNYEDTFNTQFYGKQTLESVHAHVRDKWVPLLIEQGI